MFKPGPCIVWISFVLAAPAVAAGTCERPFESLRFRASKALFLSGEVRLELTRRPADAALEDLATCQDGRACAPAGDCVLLLDAHTQATLHESQELTWVDGGRHDVLQTLAARRARRWRLTRATEDGHHQWTRRPADKKQRKRSVEEWSDRSEEHVVWQAAEDGGPRSSSFGLLYQATALRLDREGASASLQVHSKGRLLRLRLEARELVEVDVDLQRSQGGRTRHLKGEQALRRVTVDGDAVGADGSESPVGLLGMSSGIELFLEPGTGLPVEVRGDLPKLGRLRVRLVEAVLP